MVKSIGRLFLLTLFTTVISNCGSGVDFKTTRVKNIIINKTRTKQVFKWFGKSLFYKKKIFNDLKSHIYTWKYYTNKDIRRLMVESVKGKVRSYTFISSFEKDATKFFSIKRKEIKVNVTTKNKVKLLLGPSSGKAKFPSNFIFVKKKFKDKAKSAWIYAYRRFNYSVSSGNYRYFYSLLSQRNG
ncbi:MAG: hypothetical protein KAS64_03975, partial [Spirochaetes bacterium]|nr:hypothetical protein [Spirochaetota bacterium]